MKDSHKDALGNGPDGSCATFRGCKHCGADISSRRGNARLCKPCSEKRQAHWNAAHYILRNEIEKYVSGIETASEVVGKLGNEELSGRLREAARVIRGEA